MKPVFDLIRSHDLFHPQFIERFYRAVRLTDRGAERGEIMPPDQEIRPRLHRARIKRVFDVPGQPAIMGERGAARNQPKQVAPFDRRKPRVKIVLDPGAIDDRHPRRLQVVIQRLRQAKRVPVLFHIAMGHLRQPMHARIGAPGRCDRVVAPLEPGQGSLDRPLNRGLILLALPSGISGAVIFHFQRVSGHEGGISFRRAQGKGQGAGGKPRPHFCVNAAPLASKACLANM